MMVNIAKGEEIERFRPSRCSASRLFDLLFSAIINQNICLRRTKFFESSKKFHFFAAFAAMINMEM